MYNCSTKQQLQDNNKREVIFIRRIQGVIYEFVVLHRNFEFALYLFKNVIIIGEIRFVIFFFFSNL